MASCQGCAPCWGPREGTVTVGDLLTAVHGFVPCRVMGQCCGLGVLTVRVEVGPDVSPALLAGTCPVSSARAI